MTTDTAHDLTKITRFYGLSTAEKPASAMIGATFLETDTQREFVYSGDGTGWVRDHSVTVVQADAVTVKPLLDTDDLLAAMIVQQRITNAHLALVTGDEISEEDVDAGD